MDWVWWAAIGVAAWVLIGLLFLLFICAVAPGGSQNNRLTFANLRQVWFFPAFWPFWLGAFLYNFFTTKRKH